MSAPAFIRISVTGDPGSGKSTFAREVAQRTGYRLVTTGNIFRQLAADMGVSVTDLNEIAETQAQIDRKVDDYLRAMNETRENLVLDSRMAWHFVKDSLKIRLTVDLDVAVDRIFKDTTTGDFREKFSDLETARQEVQRRRESEIARYKTLYGVDISDESNFDLVINTSRKAPQDITQAFETAFAAYKSGA
jgi:cytidylate kinase